MPSVFSFSKEKNRNLSIKSQGVFPNTFSGQHGAVDLDYIPFMSSLDFISERLNITSAFIQGRF